MIGHSYFERKEYDKALPYLEDYVTNPPKCVARIFMSYPTLTIRPKITKAIEGFKQLSGKEDTLSQNAMYLLGMLTLN
jgi:hypothetical protein